MSENPQKASSSSTALFDLSKLRDELKCCICLSLFEEPKYLPCGHNCCAACVQGLIDAANQPVEFITCPECRVEVQVPANGQFPTAFAIKSLVAHFKQVEATYPNEVKLEVTGQCSACHKFLPGQESLFCFNCHDNFLALSAAHKEHEPDPLEMARAEELRHQGVQAYEWNAFEEAIQFYTQSIRECPGPICLINRAQANIKLGRFPLAYVDANEALRLDPRNERAKMFRDEALQWIGFGMEKPHISSIRLANEEYQYLYGDEDLAGNVPQQNVICKGVKGEVLEIPLHQLDTFLNEHVDGTVLRVIFKHVKFTEPMVQMLRRVKRERFEHVDENEAELGIYWHNCDFSRISEASFRFLLDELFCPVYISIIEWIGMPAGFNHNTLFKLKAFRNAQNIDFNFGRNIAPNSPNFNLHLNSDVLINFLHSPGLRMLILIDGQLQDGFDSFLDRLIQRFNDDTERRSYVVTVLVLNATVRTRQRLTGKSLILKHPVMNKDELKCTLTVATAAMRIPNHGSYNMDKLFQFEANRL